MTDDKSDVGASKKVLVVDDDATTIELVKSALGNIGFEVISAVNGEEGLQAVAQEDPQLIIIDVLMPIMDGFLLFKELKKRKQTENRRVLILTSRENVEESFLRSGADGFLTKPIDTNSLIETATKLTS